MIPGTFACAAAFFRGCGGHTHRNVFPMNHHRLIPFAIISILATASFATLSCSKKEEAPNAENMLNDAAKKLNTTISEAQKSLANSFKLKHGDIAKQIDELKAKAEKASADAKAAITAQLPELEKLRDTASNRIARLATDNSGDWQKAGQAVKDTLEDLQKRVADLVAKVK